MNTPHRETERPGIETRGIHSVRSEVEMVGGRTIRTTRPVVADIPLIVENSTAETAVAS